MSHILRLSIPVATFLAVFLPQPALAYIGPGAGLGAIAVAVALAVGIILLIAGFLWFPIKRMIKRARHSSTKDEQGAKSEKS
ncbi:hypothetical protein [Aliiruegeria lutimaris]|uniref:Uncharacterized protein n=1 Tax=Aliiruegeria lutimaris TaxID=571298 RepID=A0A1G8VEP1_9RHOB|nr:hypothetical protein [Aliiruegeria lutimaris]SDJ64377.1 hypothetical protein SAMN04488026_102123 [Aliiruegeria lutimaris]